MRIHRISQLDHTKVKPILPAVECLKLWRKFRPPEALCERSRICGNDSRHKSRLLLIDGPALLPRSIMPTLLQNDSDTVLYKSEIKARYVQPAIELCVICP